MDFNKYSTNINFITEIEFERRNPDKVFLKHALGAGASKPITFQADGILRSNLDAAATIRGVDRATLIRELVDIKARDIVAEYVKQLEADGLTADQAREAYLSHFDND